MSAELRAIIAQINYLRKTQADAKEEEDLLWKRFFEIADDLAGSQQNYRHVDPELKLFIGREMHQAAPKLDLTKLNESITPEQWEAITIPTREFNAGLLEAAITSGTIPRELVAECTEEKPPVPHRKFGEAKEKDLDPKEEEEYFIG